MPFFQQATPDSPNPRDTDQAKLLSERDTKSFRHVFDGGERLPRVSARHEEGLRGDFRNFKKNFEEARFLAIMPRVSRSSLRTSLKPQSELQVKMSECKMVGTEGAAGIGKAHESNTSTLRLIFRMA